MASLPNRHVAPQPRREVRPWAADGYPQGRKLQQSSDFCLVVEIAHRSCDQEKRHCRCQVNGGCKPEKRTGEPWQVVVPDLYQDLSDPCVLESAKQERDAGCDGEEAEVCLEQDPATIWPANASNLDATVEIFSFEKP